MKRKILSLFLILFFVVIPACDHIPADTSSLPQEYLYNDRINKKEVEKLKEILENLEDYEKDCEEYDLHKYMKYLWDTNIVYNESVYPLENEDGTISPIPLMYEPVCILSVRDSSLKTEYKKGVDYDLVNGKLVIKETGSIPRVKHKEYWLDHEISGSSFPRTGGGYILYGQGESFLSKQLAVTYIHLGEWKGEIPKGKSSLLPKTTAKLENKEELKIVFYGDSIGEGCNSSGFHKVEPFADDWCSMATKYLKEKYDNDYITMTNASVGGMDSAWGYNNYKNVSRLKPDLVVVAFGMNDGSLRVPVNSYTWNIGKIVERIRSENEECEFVLVATMLANEDVTGFAGFQEDYLPALLGLEESGVAVADMTTVHKYLLSKKRYYDMTGNNVNHPNDFLARFYAQVVIETITG